MRSSKAPRSSKAHELIIDFIETVAKQDLTPQQTEVVDLAFRDDGRSEFLRVLEIRALHLRMREVVDVIRERGIKVPFAYAEGPSWGAWRKKVKSPYCR